ncbi:MAG: hypothetical protein HYU86_09570 [Chloroflexi bacterium]|nr:hypothetical protein [Chloroflexota bacterium]
MKTEYGLVTSAEERRLQSFKLQEAYRRYRDGLKKTDDPRNTSDINNVVCAC